MKYFNPRLLRAKFLLKKTKRANWLYFLRPDSGVVGPKISGNFWDPSREALRAQNFPEISGRGPRNVEEAAASSRSIGFGNFWKSS